MRSPPQWFRDSDGTYQLVYELELTNGIPLAVEARKLVVRADGGKAVATISGKRLTTAMSPLFRLPGAAAAEIDHLDRWRFAGGPAGTGG